MLSGPLTGGPAGCAHAIVGIIQSVGHLIEGTLGRILRPFDRTADSVAGIPDGLPGILHRAGNILPRPLERIL